MNGTPAPLKIAFTGSHGTGKSWIVDRLTQHLTLEGFTVSRITSPTRYIKSLGWKNNEESGFQMQLLSGIQRVIEQRKALQDRAHVIIGDRCLMDEIAYNSYLQEHIYPNSSETEHMRLQETTNLLNEFLWDDLENYWDVIFFKPIHPSFPPEGDGDRPTDLGFWRYIDQNLSDQVYAKAPIKGYRLNPDREKAFQQVLDKLTDIGLV